MSLKQTKNELPNGLLDKEIRVDPCMNTPYAKLNKEYSRSKDPPIHREISYLELRRSDEQKKKGEVNTHHAPLEYGLKN